MGPVEVRVGRNHLRLHPKAKPQAHAIQLLHQMLQSPGELPLIDHPVPQTGTVVIPLSEPAVVQHQHLNAGRCRFPANGKDLLRIEPEVGRLPVVDQGGSGLIFVGAPNQVIPVQVMEGMGHTGNAGAGIGQHRLRGLEGFSRLQVPAEVLGMDSQNEAQLPLLGKLRLAQEISGIHQIHAVNLAPGLGGGTLQQAQEGLLLMGGNAPAGGNPLLAHGNGPAVYHPFGGPVAVEGQQVILPLVVHVQAGGKGRPKPQRPAGGVLHPDTAADGVNFPEGSIV